MEGLSQEGDGLICICRGSPDCHLERTGGRQKGLEGDQLVRRLLLSPWRDNADFFFQKEWSTAADSTTDLELPGFAGRLHMEIRRRLVSK